MVKDLRQITGAGVLDCRKTLEAAGGDFNKATEMLREKGLARALLLQARYGTKDKPERVLPRTSPAALARMVGTTPERISAVLDKFTRLGFIDDGPAGLAISTSLLSVVLHD
jgi:CRP-like cAMP-binding protein